MAQEYGAKEYRAQARPRRMVNELPLGRDAVSVKRRV